MDSDICSQEIGYDQIDVAAATERGIYVTNTPDAVREATADTALFLLLAVLRNFGEGISALQQKKWLNVCEPGRCPSSRKIGVGLRLSAHGSC